jgi:hypothetical protein
MVTSRRMIWGRACSTLGGEEDCIQDILRKPEGKRPLGRRRRRWVDKIKVLERQD